MKKKKPIKAVYYIGIGIGIILVTSFVTSQILLPILLGRAKDVATPEVVGMSLSSAKRLLNQNKLHAVVRDSLYSEDAKIETVLEQKPAPGSLLKPDGTVYLVISKGSRVVKMPTVLGMHYQEAYLYLRNMGLRSTVVDSMYSDSFPVNTVIRTSPSEGLKVDKKTNVKLYLSKGEEPLPESTELETPYYPY
jgi:serine/threonine-protein kinase